MIGGLFRYTRLALAFLLALLATADSVRSERCAPESRAIFQGITYGCERLERTEQGQGLLHWVRIDLQSPGIELYVTPLDPSARDHDAQYRLRWIGDVARSERLSVAINGALFSSKPAWRPQLPGDLAKGVETVVSDHVASHLWEHTYLLWFDDQLTPRLRPTKPPKPEELRAAKWGIGGQAVGLLEGKVGSGIERKPDSRTAIGIDPEKKLLFLAVAEWASPRLVLEQLASLGARSGMMLDGGGSSTMFVGGEARHVARGTLYGGWRPVATFFGVRARPLIPGSP